MGLNSILSGLGAPSRVFGGNSGYVGYSKSKRAVSAEANGLRNKSQMDSSFLAEVNTLISKANGTPVTLSQIKNNISKIKPDEWHHTSMYGNKTNYYSVETVASFFCPAVDYILSQEAEFEAEQRRKLYDEKESERLRMVNHLCSILDCPTGKRFISTDNPNIFLRLTISRTNPFSPFLSIVKRRFRAFGEPVDRDLNVDTLLRQFPDANVTVMPYYLKFQELINNAISALM